jgi:ATP-binding cassette subfamily C protein CydD
MRNLGMRYHAGMTGVTASVRIFQLLDEPELKRIEIIDKEPAKPDLKQPFRLTIENVSFAYPDSTRDSLSSIQISLESGKGYTLVGHSGAGKSTLLKLVMRFIEPSAGVIRLNGVDICIFHLTDWRSQISWVSQKPRLFNTSILENIRLDDPTVSEAAVWQALEQAQLADFVMRLPQKLGSPLGEWGARLSGGQAQRVALARAFLKDAPLLLMDEPNVHLDPDLEAMLAVSMEALMKQRTVVTIAHRFSTLLQASQIIVLEHGKIVEAGNHAELLEQNGAYTSLYRSGENDA